MSGEKQIPADNASTILGKLAAKFLHYQCDPSLGFNWFEGPKEFIRPTISSLSKAEFAARFKKELLSYSQEPSEFWHGKYYDLFRQLTAPSNLTVNESFDEFMSRNFRVIDNYRLYFGDERIESYSTRYSELLRIILVALIPDEKKRELGDHFADVVAQMVDRISGEMDLARLYQGVCQYYDAIEKCDVKKMQEPLAPAEPSAPPQEALAGAGAGMEAVEELPSAPPASAMEDDAEDFQDPTPFAVPEDAGNRRSSMPVNGVLVESEDEDPVATVEQESTDDPVNPALVEIANEDPDSLDELESRLPDVPTHTPVAQTPVRAMMTEQRVSEDPAAVPA